ncbi:MAG: cyclic nucleotide-binding domain-containing protein [Flavobacteriaceae bacterium]
MDLNREVELLRRIPLFSALEPAKLKLLAFTSDRVRFESGQELFHQGDVGDAAYVILRGEAAVIVDTEAGPIQVASVPEHTLVGEIAIVCDVARTATVKATTGTETLKINKDQFLRLLKEFPEMALDVMRVLAERLSATTAELSEARSELKSIETKH